MNLTILAVYTIFYNLLISIRCVNILATISFFLLEGFVSPISRLPQMYKALTHISFVGATSRSRPAKYHRRIWR